MILSVAVSFTGGTRAAGSARSRPPQKTNPSASGSQASRSTPPTQATGTQPSASSSRRPASQLPAAIQARASTS